MKNIELSPEVELAKTFEADFHNARGIEAREAMRHFGGFRFERSGVDEEGKVFFKGYRDDGTNITILVERGDNYVSPAEWAREHPEAAEYYDDTSTLNVTKEEDGLDLADTFVNDFHNARGIEAREAMRHFGGFRFERSGVDEEGKVFFKGYRDDRTNITILVEKGDDYVSPAEWERRQKDEVRG